MRIGATNHITEQQFGYLCWGREVVRIKVAALYKG